MTYSGTRAPKRYIARAGSRHLPEVEFEQLHFGMTIPREG
jgi:hypothetical protein